MPISKIILSNVKCLHVRCILEPVSQNPKIMRPIGDRPIINALFPRITDHVLLLDLSFSTFKIKKLSLYMYWTGGHEADVSL
jgi:hypothetical protein